MKAMRIVLGVAAVLTLGACSSNVPGPEVAPSLVPSLSTEMLVIEEGQMGVTPAEGALNWSSSPAITLNGSSVLEEYDGLPAPEGYEIVVADFSTTSPLLGSVTADGNLMGNIDNALPAEGHLITIAPVEGVLSLNLTYQDSPPQSLDLRSGERLSAGVLEGFYYEGATATQEPSSLLLENLAVKVSSHDRDLPWTPDGMYLLDITMKPASDTDLGECAAVLTSANKTYETRDGFFSGNIDFIVDNKDTDFTLTSTCEKGQSNITRITVTQ